MSRQVRLREITDCELKHVLGYFEWWKENTDRESFFIYKQDIKFMLLEILINNKMGIAITRKIVYSKNVEKQKKIK